MVCFAFTGPRPSTGRADDVEDPPRHSGPDGHADRTAQVPSPSFLGPGRPVISTRDAADDVIAQMLGDLNDQDCPLGR